MSNPTGRVTGYSANGYSNPRDARQANSMGYGGYTGLDAREEAYAQQFGREAQNGNFWRGAELWTTGAVLAGGTTIALERQWLKESHGSYVAAKSNHLLENITDEQWSLLNKNEKVADAFKNNKAPELAQALNDDIRAGYAKNSYKLDKNPYKELNKLLGQANDVAKVELNKIDPTKLAENVKLTKTTGLAKAGMVAGAVLTGGLLISHLSASGEGNATTQMARQRLAQLKAEEGMA